MSNAIRLGKLIANDKVIQLELELDKDSKTIIRSIHFSASDLGLLLIGKEVPCKLFKVVTKKEEKKKKGKKK